MVTKKEIYKTESIFSEDYDWDWLKNKIKGNVKINEKTNCWEWKGKLDPTGYARFQYKRQRWHAHRASFVVHNGKIPPFTMICHKCHIRHCVNPEHLYAGSHADNMRDMREAGRAFRGDKEYYKAHPELCKKGEECNFSKLTKNQVIMIKELYKLVPNCCSIGKFTGINRKTISDILNKISWSHLDG